MFTSPIRFIPGRVVRNIEEYKGLRHKIGGAHHLCISMDAAIKLTQTWTPSNEKRLRSSTAAYEYRELASHVTGGMADATFSVHGLADLDEVSPRRSAGGSFIDSPTREKTSSRLDGTTETDQLVPKGGASPVPLKLYGNR